MTTTIVPLEAATCEQCGQHVTPPLDGQFRWPRSGKTYATLQQAEARIEAIQRCHREQRQTVYEYAACQGDDGLFRIATRRIT